MNKIFRIVFNTATGRYVVASEMAKGRTKGASSAKLIAAAVLVASAPFAGSAFAAGVYDNGSLSLCEIGGTGHAYGPAGESSNLNCTGANIAFILGNQGSAAGAGGMLSTARVIGYGDGTLELKGTQGIDVLTSELRMHNSKIVGLAAGTADQDAVNVLQLKGVTSALGGGAAVNADGSIKAPSYSVGGSTFGDVGSALSNLDGRVTNNTSSIANILNGTSGLVQQAAPGQKLTVGKDTDGVSVDFTGTAGTRKLQGVSEGDISATSKEAINGSQLYATNQAVAQNTADIAKNTSDIAALDGRMGQAEAGIAQNTSDIAALDGRMGQAETTIAQNTTDIADLQGRVDQHDTDIAGLKTDTAKNTADIASLDSRTTKNEGDIANLDSRTTKNEGDIANLDSRTTKNEGDIINLDSRTTKNEGDIANIDGRVTNVEGSVTTISQQIANGEVGLVKQDAASRVITVAADRDGSEVNIAGTAGERKLSGVAEGEVSAASKEAVNGSQLHATNQAVAQNTTDIAALDGRTTKNEGDIAALDGRTTKNEGDIASLDQRQGKTEGDVSTLRTDVDGLGGRVTTIESNVDRLNWQIKQSGADAIAQSKAYTDNRVDGLKHEMDDRFDIQDKRIDRMGAMNGAMATMAANVAGLHTQDRLGVAAGMANGEVALAVGYQRAVRDSLNVTIGASVTNEDYQMGVGVGIGW